MQALPDNLLQQIILAPMGGGPGTPELVAAVSNAGGLGSLAAAYLTPEQIVADAQRVRSLTSHPFAINLFAGGYANDLHATPPEPMLNILAPIHESLGLVPPAAPKPARDPFPDQFEAMLETRPAVFSFTFGIPDSEKMSRLRSHGIFIVGTATTVEEARLLKDAGADAVVAQGSEAGAHRGTFAAPFEESMVPTLDLVRGIAGFAPVIASGGIMDGGDIGRMIAAGASAVQLGTAFLPCPESGAPEAHKKAIVAARTDTTVITRAFSGRAARGLKNTFIETLAGKEDAILPYPLQNALTRPMRTAAAKLGQSGYLSLWAGQGVARARAMPAGELVKRLLEELHPAAGSRHVPARA
jgi:nitronate monooxygenase